MSGRSVFLMLLSVIVNLHLVSLVSGGLEGHSSSRPPFSLVFNPAAPPFRCRNTYPYTFRHLR